MKHVVRGINVIVITNADIAQALSCSCSGCRECAPRNATESEPLAHAEPLANDGRVAGLPLGGEEGEEGLARDAERRRLAQTPLAVSSISSTSLRKSSLSKPNASTTRAANAASMAFASASYLRCLVRPRRSMALPGVGEARSWDGARECTPVMSTVVTFR